jgi:hypothetical protein
MRTATYGIHVPGTVYFATEKTINGNLELVRRFVRAVIAGWELLLSDYEKSFRSSRMNRTSPPGMVRFNLAEQRDFVRPLGRRVGEFDQQQ